MIVKDPELSNGVGQHGTSNQEVLRVLIDRVKFLDEQLPHKVNDEILYHLRQALLMIHEVRHVQRLVEKGCEIENIPIKPNGHWIGE